MPTNMLSQAERYVAQNSALKRALEADEHTSLRVTPLGEGEHNVNFLLENPTDNTPYVLRINVVPQPFHKQQILYEYHALQALKPSGCTPKPLYVDTSDEAPGHGAMVITFCEGALLDFDNLEPGQLDQVAQLMAQVHAVTPPQPTHLHCAAEPLRELFDECIARFELYRHSACEDARITRWTERFIARAQEIIDKTPAPDTAMHIINTEPVPSHFLLTAEQGSFIDWERAMLGEAAQDVAYFVSPTSTFWDSEYLMSADVAERFVEAYWQAVDGRFPRGTFDARFHAYLALTGLRSTTWCCKALIRYQAHSTDHRTTKTSEKLPIYLSDPFMEMVAKRCF